jgi:HlyD family secretion protein
MPVPTRNSKPPANANHGRFALNETIPALDAMLIENRRAEGRHRLLYILGAVITVALVAYMLQMRQQRAPMLPKYLTAKVARGPLIVKVTATGTLQPITQVDVGTEVSGTVETVLVNFNDHVEAGQVLARLDTTQLAAKERQSHAALRLAEARVIEAAATQVETQRKLQRADSLLKQKLFSAEEHDTILAAKKRADSSVAVAQAQVNQARAQLDYDQRLLEKAVIHAPISGIVLKRQVEPGQTVASTFQTPVLFTIAENLKQMQLHVQVDEADVGKVAVGQHAEFTVDAFPNRKFPAQITLVRYVPQTVDGVVTYETLLTVDNAELLLRPGMTVTTEILVKESRDELLVPNAALRFTPVRTKTTTPENPSLVARLMWRPPPVEKRTPDTPLSGSQVWVLRGTEAVPVAVKTGATDGINTAVTDGDLAPPSEVIVGQQSPTP